MYLRAAPTSMRAPRTASGMSGFTTQPGFMTPPTTPPRGQGPATPRGTHAFFVPQNSPRKSPDAQRYLSNPTNLPVLPVAVRGGDQLNVEKALRELLPFAENPDSDRALILKVIDAINAKEPLDVLFKDDVQMCLVDASTKPEAAYVTVYLARLLCILQPNGFNEAARDGTLAGLLQDMCDIFTPLGPETILYDRTQNGVQVLRFERHTRFNAAAREAAREAARAAARAGRRGRLQRRKRPRSFGRGPEEPEEFEEPEEPEEPRPRGVQLRL